MVNKHSRRSFLRQTGTAAGAAMVGLSLPQFLSACKDSTEARDQGAPFKTLTAAEAAELAAIAACIVPTTDTPGAREAGAIYFIDNVLGDGRADMLEPMRTGLADLQTHVQSAHAGVSSFSDLDEHAQIQMLTEIQESAFFQNIRLLTLAGVLAHPSYGGNRDKIGWKLIGFDDRHAWQPPFGYYDEQASGKPS